MPCVVAAGSWAPGRPVTKRDSSARRSHLRQPGRTHLPCVTADSPRDGCVFGGWWRFLTPGCWLLTGTGSGAPPLVEDSAPQRLQPSRHSRSRGPRPCCGGSQAPSADGLEPTLERDRKVQSPPRGRKRTRAAHGLPALAVPATGAGRLPTRSGGASPLLVSQAGPLQGPMNPPSLSLHILTSLVKFILWNSGRA